MRYQTLLQKVAKYPERHSCEGKNPLFFQAVKKQWLPFFKGMTTFCSNVLSAISRQ
jgi:hypothetical protein